MCIVKASVYMAFSRKRVFLVKILKYIQMALYVVVVLGPPIALPYPSYPGCSRTLYPFPRAPVMYLPPTPKVVTPLVEVLLFYF